MQQRTRWLAFLFLAAALPLLRAQGADGLFQSGTRAFQDGLYLMAGRSFKQLVDQYPESALADDAAYLAALSDFYREEYRGALAQFQDLARRYPQSPFARQIHFWAGCCHYRLGQYPEAVSRLLRQVQEHPEEPEYAHRALQLAGSAQEKLELWTEAQASYRRLLELKPAPELRAEAWFRLGSVQLAVRDYPAALASFTRVLVDHPDAAQAGEALFYAAESLYFAGRYAEAERRFRLALEHSGRGGSAEPQRETCLYRLARIQARLQRPSEALSSLEALQRGYPRGRYAAEIPLLRAEALFELKRYGEALAEYRRALPAAATPADRQKISYNLALAALGAGRAEEALAPLADAAQGGDAEIAERSLFRLVSALADLRRTEEALGALADYRRRFPVSSHSEELLALQGPLLERAGRPREALEVFSELMTRYPYSPKKDEYLLQRGRSRLASGDSSGALKDFFSVVQGFPDSGFRSECEYAIGAIYSGRAEYARALPYFKAVWDREKQGERAARAALAIGVCLYNTGEYRQALAWFDRLPEEAAAGAGAAQGWYYAGRALYKLEDLERAAERFGRAAAALEGSPEGEEALYWQGVSQFRLNRLGPARLLFLGLAERYPQGPRAAESLYRAGVCDALAGEHDRAVAAFDRAMEAARSARSGSAQSRKTLLEEALYQKGMSLLALGGRPKALEVFQSLAKEFPEGNLASEAFLSLAQEDFRAGSYAQALSGFQKVIREYPRRPAGSSALYWAGASCARLDRRAEALDYLLRYLESSPSGGLAKSAVEELRAVIQRAVSSPGGERELEEFLKRLESSRLPAALKDQARFEYARLIFAKDRDKALAMLLRLKEGGLADPLAGEAALLIGEAYRLRGELARSLGVFEGLASSRSPGVAARAQLGVARIREQQGRREEAAEEYLKIFFLYPQAAEQAEEGLYQAGRLYWEAGRKEEARKLFARLAERYPASPWRSKLP